MAIDTTKLLADMTSQTTVLNSLVLFVQGQKTSNDELTQQVADLKAALAAAQVNDPVVQAAVDAIDGIAVSNTALAQGALPAVTANTPTPPAQAAQAAAAASQ